VARRTQCVLKGEVREITERTVDGVTGINRNTAEELLACQGNVQ
jgi:hypothetical protein